MKGDTMQKILVIEDELKIRKIIKDYFCASGYLVDEAADGMEGVTRFEEGQYDLVILDVMMPELDGWEVCKHIRTESDVPIIMLTARGEEEDKLTGFELRADDYVTKPFSPKVLVARAKMLLARTKGTVLGDDNQLVVGKVTIQTAMHRVLVDGQELDLQPKEYDMLLYFMENQGHALQRVQILNRVWGYDYEGDLRVVDTQIKKLRKQLGAQASYIRTVHGVGYRFEEKE